MTCHRASAAFRALSERSSGVRLAARAFPPMTPPLRPRATAAGSFTRGSGSGSLSPIEKSTTALASWFGSRGMRERLGMSGVYYRGARGRVDCESCHDYASAPFSMSGWF